MAIGRVLTSIAPGRMPSQFMLAALSTRFFMMWRTFCWFKIERDRVDRSHEETGCGLGLVL